MNPLPRLVFRPQTDPVNEISVWIHATLFAAAHTECVKQLEQPIRLPWFERSVNSCWIFIVFATDFRIEMLKKHSD